MAYAFGVSEVRARKEQWGKTHSLCLSPSKLALASLQLGVTASASGCGWERGRPLCTQRMKWRPFSLSRLLANAIALSCKHAKACLRGEGQDEGGLWPRIRFYPEGPAAASVKLAMTGDSGSASGAPKYDLMNQGRLFGKDDAQTRRWGAITTRREAIVPYFFSRKRYSAE